MEKETKRNLVLEGKYVRLEEVQPKHFPYIIEWRNNPEFNKYLNQPYKLTMENQTKWYEEKYLQDMTQGLFVMIDKEKGIFFGIIGYTDFSAKDKSIETGRLLVGNLDYRGSKQWDEAVRLINNFVYQDLQCDVCYAHTITENIASCKWHLKWGYVENPVVKFPHKLEINGMKQIELHRTKEMYANLMLRQKE